MMKKRILFVCHGNTCRSPMAKAMAEKLFGNFIEADSAGLETITGMCATEKAAKVMLEKELNISDHQSKNIDEINLLKYDAIVAMTPQIGENITTLNNIKNIDLFIFNIPDPYGREIETYRDCAKIIEASLKELFPKICP